MNGLSLAAIVAAVLIATVVALKNSPEGPDA